MNDDRSVVYSTEQGEIFSKNSTKKRKQQAHKAPVIKNPAKQGIRIRRESKGRGGKTVSIVDGLPLTGSELKILLKQLKGQLGTGGAIKNGLIEIQGDHRERIITLLEQRGYSAKLAGG